MYVNLYVERRPVFVRFKPE